MTTLIWRNLVTMIIQLNPERCISPLEICKEKTTKEIPGLKCLMKLFQNQKLESESNDFRSTLIVSFHPTFLNKEDWGWNFQKMGKGVTNFGGSFSHSRLSLSLSLLLHSSLGSLFLKVVVSGSFKHFSHHTDFLLLFLKFSFSPACEYLKCMSLDFRGKIFKLFSLNTYCLFFIKCISLHIFCKWWGTWSWDYWWKNAKGGDMGETT